MRLVFMGTPAIAWPILRGLYLEHDILAVYTQPDKQAGRGQESIYSPIKQKAVELGLNIEQPLTLKDSCSISRFKILKPDTVIVVAYGQILPPQILEIPPYGCINIHFSLLPLYRGASPLAGAILAGDRVTGISIMLMDRGMDTGPLLAQAQIPVFDWDTSLSLGEKLSTISAGMLLEVLPAWTRGEIKPRSQPASSASYSGIISKEAGLIDWNEPAIQIWRKSRAYYPWPGVYTFWRGRRLKLIKVSPANYPPGSVAGKIIKTEYDPASAFGIITGAGLLKVHSLQLEGKRAVSSFEFLNGQQDIIDANLIS